MESWREIQSDNIEFTIKRLREPVETLRKRGECLRIIQHPESFEVRSEVGAIMRQFAFDDDTRRRATSGRMSRKQAFQAAKVFAGKGYTVETAKQQDWNFAADRLPRRHA